MSDGTPTESVTCQRSRDHGFEDSRALTSRPPRNRQDEDEFVHNKILDSFVLIKEQNVGTIQDYVTRTEVEHLIRTNINATVEFARK